MKTPLDILELTNEMFVFTDKFRQKDSEWLKARKDVLKARLIRLARLIETSNEKQRIGWVSMDVMVELMALNRALRANKRFRPGGYVPKKQSNAREMGEWVIQNQN